MSEGARRITSNSAMLMFAEFFRKALRMLLVVFAGRLLGDDAYGQFAFALAFTTLFWIFADLGIHQLLVREIARDRNRAEKYLGNAIVVKLFLSIFTLILIYFLARLTQKPPEVLTTVYILALVVISLSFINLFKSVFQAFQQMQYDAASTILETTLLLVLGMGVLAMGRGIQTLAWVYLIGHVATLVFCVVVVSRKFTRISPSMDWSLIKHLFHEGIPIGINYFFTTTYSYASTTMLSLMATDEEVAWFSIAYRLVQSFQFIGMGITRAVYPALSNYYQETKEKFVELFVKTYKVMLLIGVSLATMLSLLSEKIIVFLWGDEFRNAALALSTLAWAMIFVLLNVVMASTTRSCNRQRFTAKVVGVAAFINIGLNYFLISKFSYIGAAYAALCTEIFVFVSHTIYLAVYVVRPPVLKELPKIVVVNFVLGAYLACLSSLNLIVLLCSGCLLFGVMVWLVRFFSEDEVRFLRGLFRPLKK